MLTSLNSGLIKPKGLHRVLSMANGNGSNGAREEELVPSHWLLNWTTVQGREQRSSSLIVLDDSIIPSLEFWERLLFKIPYQKEGNVTVVEHLLLATKSVIPPLLSQCSFLMNRGQLRKHYLSFPKLSLAPTQKETFSSKGSKIFHRV